ncbi:MAG: LegC family aminotransferase [Fibrobacteres bacterium]|nr:LegC family aminotransferase [Fibrobacterota bacterium]
MSVPAPGAAAPGTAPDASGILAAVRRATGRERIPALHEPIFRGRESEYLQDCLTTTLVSSVGPYVDRFEVMLAEITGAGRAVATVNGTAALHVCLLLAGVRPGDEVIIPTLTFVATANAVSYCGAVPHLADANFDDMGIDAAALRAYLAGATEIHQGECRNRGTGRRIRAVVPMHTFGHPSDLDALAAVCADFRLVLIEDAAEALGSRYRGRHVGNHGSMSSLSFNGNKIVTTGGGGAILTNDPELGRQAKHITTTAKLPHPWAFRHDQIGFNYRMPNLNAALGCAQLERLSEFLAAKRSLAKAYRDAFAGMPGLRFVDGPAGTESNFWLNAIMLDEEQAGLRDVILELAMEHGVAMRPAWVPMHQMPIYAACPRMVLRTADSLARRILNLPSGAGLGTD